jgi:hypothetical protein
MGRKKLWPERMDAMLPEGTFARMDRVRADGETRTDLIRVAVERELARREGDPTNPVNNPLGDVNVDDAEQESPGYRG